ncbi:MAG: hypothetical protein M3O31_11925 [Acidobacteriota bacterium]|nr:hypothetical protein [Acidobacteriota bacterium]
MNEVVRTMAEGIQGGLIEATQVAREADVRQSANGIRFAVFGDTGLADVELARMVQAVPSSMAAALAKKSYFFVPLALADGRAAEAAGHRKGNEVTLISPEYTTDLADQAICHRNVVLGTGEEAGEGVFISARLLNDRFSLAFEYFINVGHAFVDEVGVAESFAELAWNQAVVDVRGETSQDAWESRAAALGAGDVTAQDGKPRIDEKAKTDFLEAAFSDAVAIYMLSLSVDFDYSELREREYPLLAPQALAERLRLVAKLFPPNADYEFAIRYRRRP